MLLRFCDKGQQVVNFFFVFCCVKKPKKDSFIHFLGESKVHQSAYGFIRPLGKFSLEFSDTIFLHIASIQGRKLFTEI